MRISRPKMSNNIMQAAIIDIRRYSTHLEFISIMSIAIEYRVL